MQKILPYILIFFLTFSVLQWFQSGSQADQILSSGAVGLRTVQSEVTIGNELKVLIQNNQKTELVLKNRCPQPTLDVFVVNSTGPELVQKQLDRDCSASADFTLAPGEKTTLSLKNYAYSLLGNAGTYKVGLSLPAPTEADPTATQTYYSPEFKVVEPGLFTKAFRNLISYPILNALVAIVVYMPGHHLGLAIILLTLIIRTILLIPSQRAMRAQKRLQDIQPRLEELKTRHGNDQARLAQETMLIWKEAGVNPLSSCLPMLLQLPILIALFYAIQNGLSPDSQSLIYSFIPPFSLNDIDPFFGPFNLFEKNLIVFPLAVGFLQFLQMQLMMSRQKKTKTGQSSPMAPEMESMNKVMKYMMPVMIALFTAQTPAAVGLYWGIGTCYGIVQQIVVNKERPQTNRSNDEVQIRVVNKKA